MLPRTATAAGHKECESSLSVLSGLQFHSSSFGLSLAFSPISQRYSQRTSLRLGLSFSVGTFQHTGALFYLRLLDTSVNKQDVLTGLQFQSTCMKVLESRAVPGTERKSILTRVRSGASRAMSETKGSKERNRRNSAPEN